MSDPSDFKRRVYEPEVAALKQRIATLERERDEARLDRNEARDVCFVLRARADRYEKAATDACRVAIWLSALVGNPDGASDPVAQQTWEEQMRPPLHAALDVLLARAALAGEDA